MGSAYFPHRRMPVAYETQTCGNHSDHGQSISDCNTRWTSFDFSVVMPVARRNYQRTFLLHGMPAYANALLAGTCMFVYLLTYFLPGASAVRRDEVDRRDEVTEALSLKASESLFAGIGLRASEATRPSSRSYLHSEGGFPHRYPPPARPCP